MDTPIRIHLTSGESIVTCIDLAEEDELRTIQQQLSGDLDWQIVGDALVFPSRVAAVELL